MDNIIHRTEQDKLKVNLTKVKIYGLTIPGIIEIVKNNWILFSIWTILFYVLGAATEPIVQRYFGLGQ